MTQREENAGTGKRRDTVKTPWYVRWVQKLGLAPHSWEARDAVQGTSKHGRAKTQRHDLERWRKRRRLMAKASRRRNWG